MFIGGSDPNGFQSVILSPEWVRRVTPPTWTIPATNPDVPSIHFATGAYGLRAVLESAGNPLLIMEDDIILLVMIANM